MTGQLSLLDSHFDLRLGQALKEAGLQAASDAKADLLALGRAYVRRAALGRADRSATADDAAVGLVAAGLPADALGNAAGALFRGRDWRFTGRWEKSSRTTNHAHQNRVWELIA